MARRKHSAGKKDVHQAVTEAIVRAMEEGVESWQMPWHRSPKIPTNVETGNEYHGVNVLSLWSAAMIKEHHSPYWGTYRQWQNVGGQVREREKSSIIVFYKLLEVQNDVRQSIDQTLNQGEEDSKTIPLLRYSPVFNAEQQDGWEEPVPEQKDPVAIIDHVQAFVTNTRAAIHHGGGRAYYRPSDDTIHMPDIERFHGTKTSTATEAYFSTELHELTHWTGHETRCRRDIKNRFGSEPYAFEELVAELGSAFLCSELEINNTPREDHAQYIASWIKALQSDTRAIFKASKLATAALSFLKELQPESNGK